MCRAFGYRGRAACASLGRTDVSVYVVAKHRPSGYTHTRLEGLIQKVVQILVEWYIAKKQPERSDRNLTRSYLAGCSIYTVATHRIYPMVDHPVEDHLVESCTTGNVVTYSQ